MLQERMFLSGCSDLYIDLLQISVMKYPFENTTVWDLIRHPFDEDSGDPGGRTFMRVLSNIFFPIYVFLQVYVPFQVTMDICLDSGQTMPNVEQIEQVEQHAESQAYQSELMVERLGSIGQQEDPMWLTVMVVFKVWLSIFVGFWAIGVILSVFVRYFTSTYFHRQLIVGFCGAICLCTKKGSPNNIKWNERLDKAMINLDMANAECDGKALLLTDIVDASCDLDKVNLGIKSYMEDLKGDFSGPNIARLFLALYNEKIILSDTVATFYRVLKMQYPEGNWVIENTVQRAAKKLNSKESAELSLQENIIKKYFSQITTN